MYRCERCGTSFARRAAVVESCPRCLARDGVRVTLVLSLFEGAAGRIGPARPGPARPSALEAAVRRRLASGAR